MLSNDKYISDDESEYSSYDGYEVGYEHSGMLRLDSRTQITPCEDMHENIQFQNGGRVL